MAGTCGAAGTAGDFALTTQSTTYTVDVGANTTTFQERGRAHHPSTSSVLGDRAQAVGTLSSSAVLTATKVVVIPPRPNKASGTVASVNGTNVAGMCGAAGTAGDFALTTQSTTYTVDVWANTTTFQERGVSAPSFDIVCVGDRAEVGTRRPARSDRHQGGRDPAFKSLDDNRRGGPIGHDRRRPRAPCSKLDGVERME